MLDKLEAGTKVYLMGPMSGLPEHNFPAFNEAAKRLRNAGLDVFNPAENMGGDVHYARKEYMRIDFEAIFKSAACIALPGWYESQGANAEMMMSHELSLPVFIYKEKGDSFELEDLETAPPRLPYALDDDTGFKSVLLEAEEIINGARRSAYGHPLDDYTKVSGMANALFAELLAPGKEFTAEHMTMWFQLVKLSREMNCSKRDNCVDGCGYWGVLDMIKQERARRADGKKQ